MFSTLLKTKFIISSTLILLSAHAFNLDQSKILSFGKEFNVNTILLSTYRHVFKPYKIPLLIFMCVKPFIKRKNLNSSNLKEIADDNFMFDENGRKFSKMGRKHSGKRRYCPLRAVSPFHTVFSIDFYCRQLKTRVC